MAESPTVGLDPQRQRMHALDGLRGLAAVSVVTLHFLSVFLDTSYPRYQHFDLLIKELTRTPIGILWAGGQAVSLFFILSGFVLHRMLSAEHMNYRNYAARRIIRLWIPYEAVIILASVGIYLGGSHTIPGQSGWMNIHLGTTISPAMLAQHTLMVGVFNTSPIDFVVWSLVLEMRLSLVFPMIYWVTEHFRARYVLAVSFAISVAAVYLGHRMHTSSVSLTATAGCQVLFVAGALISRNEIELRRAYVGFPNILKIAMFFLALVLYCDCLRISPTFSLMFGAIGLFVFALCSDSTQAVLCTPFAQWLGRISYSLYLSHAVVMLLLINLLYPRLSFDRIVAICVPVVFLIAVVLYRTVERPAITLSRNVGRRLKDPLEAGLTPSS